MYSVPYHRPSCDVAGQGSLIKWEVTLLTSRAAFIAISAKLNLRIKERLNRYSTLVHERMEKMARGPDKLGHSGPRARDDGRQPHRQLWRCWPSCQTVRATYSPSCPALALPTSTYKERAACRPTQMRSLLRLWTLRENRCRSTCANFQRTRRSRSRPWSTQDLAKPVCSGVRLPSPECPTW